LVSSCAYSRDFHYNYSLYPSVVFEKIDKMRKYCNTLNFQNEVIGMCCVDEKIKFPELHSPSEPLSRLLSSDTILSKHFLSNERKYNKCFKNDIFWCDKYRAKKLHANIQIARSNLLSCWPHISQRVFIDTCCCMYSVEWQKKDRHTPTF